MPFEKVLEVGGKKYVLAFGPEARNAIRSLWGHDRNFIRQKLIHASEGRADAVRDIFTCVFAKHHPEIDVAAATRILDDLGTAEIIEMVKAMKQSCLALVDQMDQASNRKEILQ